MAQDFTDAPLPATAGFTDAPVPSAAPQTAQGHDPNTMGTFASHVLAQVNPVTAVTALAHAALHPVDTVHQLTAAQQAVWDKAKASYQKGDYADAAVHALNSVVPLFGPSLDAVAEHVSKGELAAGFGDAAGMALALAAPEVAGGIGRGAGALMDPDALESAAGERLAQTISPSGSSKEIRTLGKQAARVGPQVLGGTSAITPSGLADQIGQQFANASDKLDAAYDAIPKNRGYSPNPLISRLQRATDDLRVQGSGGSVIPTPDVPRAAAIQQAMAEVQALGPFSNTENFAKLRDAWSQQAKPVYAPVLDPNAAQLAQSASKGWADARAELQGFLTDRHPELKPLNADYSVWKTANDVVQAAADRERVRPTVGRNMLASGVGSLIGSGVGAGPLVAGVGGALAPLVERGLSGTVGPAFKLTIARLQTNLADALRTGDFPKAQLLTQTLRPLLVAASPLRVPTALPAAAQPTPAP